MIPLGLTCWLCFAERRRVPKGFEAGRDGVEGLAGHLTDDGLTQELLPPAFGLTIIHDQIGVSELAGGSEELASSPGKSGERRSVSQI